MAKVFALCKKERDVGNFHLIYPLPRYIDMKKIGFSNRFYFGFT